MCIILKYLKIKFGIEQNMDLFRSDPVIRPDPSILEKIPQELEVWFLSHVWCPAPMSQYAISKWLPQIFIRIFKEHFIKGQTSSACEFTYRSHRLDLKGRFSIGIVPFCFLLLHLQLRLPQVRLLSNMMSFPFGLLTIKFFVVFTHAF